MIFICYFIFPLLFFLCYISVSPLSFSVYLIFFVDSLSVSCFSSYSFSVLPLLLFCFSSVLSLFLFCFFFVPLLFFLMTAGLCISGNMMIRLNMWVFEFILAFLHMIFKSLHAASFAHMNINMCPSLAYRCLMLHQMVLLLPAEEENEYRLSVQISYYLDKCWQYQRVNSSLFC